MRSTVRGVNGIPSAGRPLPRRHDDRPLGSSRPVRRMPRTHGVGDPVVGVELLGGTAGQVPAATIAAATSPRSATTLTAASLCCGRRARQRPGHRRSTCATRSALAFMRWQLRRGLLNPIDGERPGGPWWRAVRTTAARQCEGRSRLLGHPGPASSPSVEPSVGFARGPSPLMPWPPRHDRPRYLDTVTWPPCRAVLHQPGPRPRAVRPRSRLAPRLALAWLAPIARWLGDPRREPGTFLSVSQVLPRVTPRPEGSTPTSPASTPWGGSSTSVSSCPA